MRIYLNKLEIEALLSWDECPNSIKKKLGIVTVYLIEIFDSSNKNRYWEIYKKPQRSDKNGEFRIKGYLGINRNKNRVALGKYKSIDDAIETVEKEYGYKIKAIEMRNNFDEDLLWMGKISDDEVIE